MNSEKYPVQNYVPYNPTKEYNRQFGHDLDTTLLTDKYNKIVNDPDYHFNNSYVINFDIINHECRGGDSLSHDRKYYETIHKKKLNEEIKSDESKYRFISSALKSERKDVFIEKNIFSEHFDRYEANRDKLIFDRDEADRDKLEKELEKKGIFLSSMKRRAYLRKKNKTDDCKSLKF